MQATAIKTTSTSADDAQDLYVYATSQVAADHENYGDSYVGDYVAEEKAIQFGTAHHDADFKAVCMSAQSAAKQMLAGNHVFYEHIAKLTTWFPTVEGTPYLDTLIKDKTKKAYKKKVSYGINFVPVIDAVWSGIDRTDLPVNKTNRISRVLNVLYKVYREKFNSDPTKEAELVQYIIESGGVSGLVSYNPKEGLSDDDFPDVGEDKKNIKKARALADAGVATAYQDSVNYFNDKNNLPTASFTSEIALNEDNLSLVLVKRKKDHSYSVIESVIDNKYVSNFATKSYMSHYAALPPAMRFIVETLSTQFCPAEQEGTFTHVLNEASKVTTEGTRNAIRRLIYKHAQGSFLLSNIHSTTGMVTVAKPKQEILAGSVDDVTLTTSSRRGLETYLVGPKNFRLLDFNVPLGNGPIPHSGDDFTNSFSISVLTEKMDGDFKKIQLHFGRESTERLPHLQVDVRPDPDEKPEWERMVDSGWFKTFNAAFTHNWVNSHARHVNRPHQAVLDVLFRITTMTVNFFNMENVSDLSTIVHVPTGGIGEGSRRSFLSKDLAIAMLQLGDMPIVGKATISLFPAFLRIRYETEVGEYSLYIPTVNSVGIHQAHGFGQYSMQSIVPVDHVIDALVGDTNEGDL